MIAVILIFDLSDKLGKFMEKQIPFKRILFEYYISLVPYYLHIFMSLFVFLGIIFFTSKMASKSEIIAMMSNGISFGRIFLPYLISAFILVVFSFLLGNFIIPASTQKRIEFENQFIYYRPNVHTNDVHKQISKGVFIYIKFFDPSTDIGHIFTIEKFDGTDLKSKMYADNIFWDEEKQLWQANNYWIRTYDTKQDIIETGDKIDTNIYITPNDIKESIIDIETLNLFELNQFIDEQKLHGNDSINEFILTKHKRFGFPFSIFILTFLGYVFSFKKKRGGTGINLGIGIVISSAFILFSKLSDQLAINGNLTPFLAVWLPNFIFVIISFIIYKFVSK